MYSSNEEPNSTTSRLPTFVNPTLTQCSSRKTSNKSREQKSCHGCMGDETEHKGSSLLLRHREFFVLFFWEVSLFFEGWTMVQPPSRRCVTTPYYLSLISTLTESLSKVFTRVNIGSEEGPTCTTKVKTVGILLRHNGQISKTKELRSFNQGSKTTVKEDEFR